MEAKRAEKTIEYISFWEKEGPQKSYRYLEDNWAEFLKAVPPDQRAIADVNPDAKDKLLDHFYADSSDEEPWRLAVGTTAYFFNRLGLCVQAKLCSDKVAKVFFGDILRPYIVVFGPYIKGRDNDMAGSLDIIRLPLE